MIDVHCHLEQKDYDKDRDAVIEACGAAGIRAIITSCANPKDWKLTMGIVKKHEGFVFASSAIHPEYVKETGEQDVDAFISRLRESPGSVVAVGECGLDYNWVKEPEWRERQSDLFRRFIGLANETGKPLVVHLRDAYAEGVEILEQEGAKEVMLHMFGANQLVPRVVDNGWHVSMNAIVLRGKKQRKVVRDVPMERLMLETDAPWLHPSGQGRNDSRSIRQVAEKVAEIKGMGFDDVWRQAGENAVGFFNLPSKLLE